MTITVMGQVVDRKGLAVHRDDLGDPADAFVIEPLDYRRAQPNDLPVYLGHDPDYGRLGQVVYLERSARFGLVAAATITADIGDLLDAGPWYWSEHVTSRHLSRGLQRSDAVISEISLVRATAHCVTSALLHGDGDFDQEPRTMSLWERSAWERAAAFVEAERYRYHRATDPTTIVDLDPLDIHDEWRTDRDAAMARLRAAVDSRPVKVRTTPTVVLHDRVYRHAWAGHLDWVDD